jgi:hypothetical protein
LKNSTWIEEQTKSKWWNDPRIAQRDTYLAEVASLARSMLAPFMSKRSKYSSFIKTSNDGCSQASLLMRYTSLRNEVVARKQCSTKWLLKLSWSQRFTCLLANGWNYRLLTENTTGRKTVENHVV